MPVTADEFGIDDILFPADDSAFFDIDGFVFAGFELAACDYPAVGNVRLGVAYGSGTLTGTLELPAVGDVRLGEQYGAGGTEFTGTLDAPEPTPISDDDTLHWRIKTAAKNVILALNLAGDGVFGGIGTRVYSQLLPDEVGLQFPCILLTTEGQAEEMLDGDSTSQRWRWPVRIWIADRESDRKHQKEKLYMAWRKILVRTFDQQNPIKADVPESEGCRITPEIIFDPRLPDYQYLISGLVLWTSATERR